VCQEIEFTPENPPAYIPGCPHYHTGAGVEGPVCASCVFLTLKLTARADYFLTARGFRSENSLQITPCNDCRMLSEETVFGNQALEAVSSAQRVWDQQMQSQRDSVDRASFLKESLQKAALAAESALGLAIRCSFPEPNDGSNEERERKLWKLLLDAIFEAFKKLHPQEHIRKSGERSIYFS
jgi:hypothetical protein